MPPIDREFRELRSGDRVEYAGRIGQVEYWTDTSYLYIDVRITHTRKGKPVPKSESPRWLIRVHPQTVLRLRRDVPPEIVDRAVNPCDNDCNKPNVPKHRCFGRRSYRRGRYDLNPFDCMNCGCECHALPSYRQRIRYAAHAKCADYAIRHLDIVQSIAMDSDIDTPERHRERVEWIVEMIRRNGTHSDEIAADEERFDCSVFPGAEFDFPRK